MEFRLFPYGEVYAGMFLWPYERHAEVLRAWHAWTRTAPEEITTSFRIMHFPPLPELPPFLSGRSVVVVDGAYAGGIEAGAAAIAALRALAPELDTWAPSSPAALSRIHMDPEEPMPYVSEAALVLGELDESALDAFAASIQPGAPRPVRRAAPPRRRGRRACPRAPAPRGGCTASTCMFGGRSCWRPRLRRPPSAALEAFRAAMTAYDTGKGYLNFVEEPTDAATLYGDDDYARLRAVRAAVDPDGRMVGNHPIPGA